MRVVADQYSAFTAHRFLRFFDAIKDTTQSRAFFFRRAQRVKRVNAGKLERCFFQIGTRKRCDMRMEALVRI